MYRYKVSIYTPYSGDNTIINFKAKSNELATIRVIKEIFLLGGEGTAKLYIDGCMPKVSTIIT